MKSYSQWQLNADQLKFNTKAFIGGHFVEAQDESTFACINPANKQHIADITRCGEHEVEQAVRCARTVFELGEWSRFSPSKRKKILLRLAQLIEENSDELALLDTLDMGKPIAETTGFDLPATIDVIRWTAESIDKVYGDIAPTGEEALALISREPIGVVAAIVPWNYPLMMAVWKIAPALAMGNSVLLKPSEKSSLSAIRLAELVQEAGIPDGVFNVLPGEGHITGKALALHNDIDVLAFTGSTSVGKQLLVYAGQSNMKRVWLETGGKSPVIVFADCADLQAAAAGVALGIFNNQGETCIATSRLLLEESIRDEFLALLKVEAAHYVPSDPLDPATVIGPLVDESHDRCVQQFIRSGLDEGASLLLDQTPDNPDGYYQSPTIFCDTNADMSIVRDEIFGPVLAVDTFSDWQQAIDKANDSDYGLGAGVWTNNINKAHQSSRALNAGMVWINNWAGGNSATPFGGIKQSGNGRDKSLHALEKYSELKSVWVALQSV